MQSKIYALESFHSGKICTFSSPPMSPVSSSLVEMHWVHFVLRLSTTFVPILSKQISTYASI